MRNPSLDDTSSICKEKDVVDLLHSKLRIISCKKESTDNSV